TSGLTTRIGSAGILTCPARVHTTATRFSGRCRDVLAESLLDVGLVLRRCLSSFEAAKAKARRARGDRVSAVRGRHTGGSDFWRRLDRVVDGARGRQLSHDRDSEQGRQEVSDDDLIVTTQHLYSVPNFNGRIGFCARGTRAWCA